MRQVDEVVCMESQAELEEGGTPGPMAELQFWEARSRNLESLYEQLTSRHTQAMATVLGLTRSGYHKIYLVNK